MRKTITVTMALLFMSACIPEDHLPRKINYQQMCGGDISVDCPRAEAGDSLCVGKEDCYETSGSPDHTGCPQTCSCLCYKEACYELECTTIYCQEPPEYR